MMKKLCSLPFLLLLLFSLLGCSGPGEDVAAKFRGETITTEAVETYARYCPFEEVSDREIVTYLVRWQILLEDAENRGLAVTEEDIEQFLKDTVYASYEMPDGKTTIDSYCESLGITFEEYVERIRYQAPPIIAMAKVQEAVAKEYCETNDIPFDALNPTNDVREAIDEYTVELFEGFEDDIVFFVD